MKMRWYLGFAAMLRDRDGAVSLITAFALPALVATLALGTEVSYWLVKNRGLQNAADSAVVAASIDASPDYLTQAKAVVARYGLVDGVGGVVVTASNAAACPAGGTDCYSVTVATTLPTYLGRVVGYAGAATIDGASGTRLSAVAFAKPSGSSHAYCLIGLANDGRTPAIVSKGSPKANLTGCGVYSNTAMSCAGHDLNATYGDARDINDGCGITRRSSVSTPLVDPFATLASALPADTCSGAYPQSGAVPVSSRWSGTRTLGSQTTICGDLLLTGDVTINAPSNAVLIIRNGEMIMNGFRFQTAPGAGLAVVFTGSNNALYHHSPTGNGALDIAAPTTGSWSGVAMYQDPALTIGVAMPNAAGAPTWEFSGLIYLPRVDLDFRGSVGKGSNGALCTVIVANSISLNGTGFVLSTLECGAAGLDTPDSGFGGRGTLVG